MIDGVMLLSNGLVADPRVQKEARSLASRGYALRVLAWDRGGDLPSVESRDGYDVVRFAHRSRPGSGLRQALSFLRFSVWAVREGIRARPRLVHCHDLDTFVAGLIIAALCRVPLLFDSHELYAEMQRERMPRLIVSILWVLEKWAIRKADATLVVGAAIRDFLASVRSDLVVVGNWHEVAENDAALRAATRAELGVPADAFLIGFIGGLQSTRNLDPLFAAVDADDRLFAVVAGRGDQEQKVRAEAARQPRVRYIGFTTEPGRYFAASDALYYLFDPAYAYANFSTSNTVGLAFAHRKPLITDTRGDTGRVASSVLPDIALREPTGPEVLRVVNLLRDPAVRVRVESNMRRAAEETYSWAAAERELAAVYARLLTPRRNS